MQVPEEVGKTLFTNQVVNEWNNLCSSMVGENTIDDFKGVRNTDVDGK